MTARNIIRADAMAPVLDPFPHLDVSKYNRGRLKSTGPKLKDPAPRPDEFRSLKVASDATNAARTHFPHLDTSKFNKGRLKSTGPKLVYPLGDGPMTEAKAIAIMEGAADEQKKVPISGAGGNH